MAAPSDGFGYEDAVVALHDAVRFGIHPSLLTIEALTEAMGRPQDAFRAIQIAGTNGKGSVARMVATLLEAHGVRTGCYTSPHLLEYRERIEVGGLAVGRERFARAVHTVLTVADGLSCHDDAFCAPTEFEILTAAALRLFKEAQVEVGVLEVGMGARWDATSVVSPEAAAVVSVAMDHAEHLGDTLEAIAAEKAWVMREGACTVIGPDTAGVEEVLAGHARRVGADLVAVRTAGQHTSLTDVVTFEVLARPTSPDGTTRFSVDGLHPARFEVAFHQPAYQAGNATVALAVAEATLGRLDPSAVSTALSGLSLPGRFEVVRREPWLVLDGAHNPHAATVLAEAVRDAFGESGPTVLLGVLSDKDARGIIEALAPVAGHFAVMTPTSERAMPAEGLSEVVAAVTGERPAVFAGMSEALEELRVRRGDDVVVTGSLVTVTDAERIVTR